MSHQIRRRHRPLRVLSAVSWLSSRYIIDSHRPYSLENVTEDDDKVFIIHDGEENRDMEELVAQVGPTLDGPHPSCYPLDSPLLLFAPLHSPRSGSPSTGLSRAGGHPHSRCIR